MIELGAIVGEPPTVWGGPLSIDVALTGELLDRTCAGPGRAGRPDRGGARGDRREALPRDHPDRAVCGFRAGDDTRFNAARAMNNLVTHE